MAHHKGIAPADCHTGYQAGDLSGGGAETRRDRSAHGESAHPQGCACPREGFQDMQVLRLVRRQAVIGLCRCPRAFPKPSGLRHRELPRPLHEAKASVLRPYQDNGITNESRLSHPSPALVLCWLPMLHNWPLLGLIRISRKRFNKNLSYVQTDPR